ncbi:TRAP transporter small permease [Pseudorhodobacter sp. E13]|uniref:TRAP transporter small permease n=1 Tax=Pseudorhodobacter sp. E13 TaxID=2487931 RepID=UPI000F8E8A13|nr:TRAP transporter small permease [Pseudorhodobacter sp. E13]RUS58959.1 TRAP transporter small permease [Pseudorhodobacter sp. E13]
MSAHYVPKTAFGRAIHTLEETAIALILGLMTMLTFANVVLRYVFNSSIFWGFEVTLSLFAWLVLFGMSYAVKVTAHLGVDAVVNMLPSKTRRIMSLVAVTLCLAYAFLLLKGAWDYWAPFGGFQQTGGRWFPEGFIKTRDQGWYVTETIPMPDWLRFIEGTFNAGESYDKLPRFIPYFMLPFGCALLLFRYVQAAVELVQGKRTALIVSHEAEEAVQDVRHLNAED